MSDNPFQAWATQTYNDTQRLSQTIDAFLAAKPQPQVSNVNASAVRTGPQNQSSTASSAAQIEAAPQKALYPSLTASRADQTDAVRQPSKALVFGVGALIVGGIVLLGSLLKNDAKE